MHAWSAFGGNNQYHPIVICWLQSDGSTVGQIGVLVHKAQPITTLCLASGGALQRIKLISGPSQSKFPASRSISGRSELSELDLQLSCLSIDSRTSKFIVKKSISQDHADTKDSTTKNLSILSQIHIERSLKKFTQWQRLRLNLRLGVDTYDKFNLTNHELWENLLKANGPVPILESEAISIESKELLNATARLINPNRDSFPVGVDLAKISYPPYDFFYHYAAGLRECGLKNFQKDMQTQLMMLLDFVERYTCEGFWRSSKFDSAGVDN